MKDFYTAFYAAVETSAVHHAFCERVFGLDLAQHGFADVGQLELLLRVTGLGPGQRAVDLGCGNGKIAEYLSDRSGAHVTGLDNIPDAIRQAQQRTVAKADRLALRVGDLRAPGLPDGSFDVVLSLDTVYFSDDYAATLKTWRAALQPGGQMAILYSYGREPWVAREDFPRENLAADRTPLAEALCANGLAFETWDLTECDDRLARRRQAVLADLAPQFEAEGLQFIYENRLGDAEGIRQAIEEALHARYLYRAWRVGPNGAATVEGRR